MSLRRHYYKVFRPAGAKDTRIETLIRGQLGRAPATVLLVSTEIVASHDDFCDTTGARRLRRFSGKILQALFSFHSLSNFERRSGVNAALLKTR